ncbi:P2Y purinoceptor 11-like [Clarias gariepinus]|uniref:P2Y purinoceptor 11-like n=1 Tax=Clarias gariepinus TaxID=13013 RepID=UPI00234DC44C|nr:P2Y purinoceptor 11-like [Clarias gariepinus]
MSENSNCSSKFQKNLLPSIYSVELGMALVMNIVTLWVLVTKKRTNWNTGVVFFCNLLISNILYALTLPFLIDYYSKGRKWDYGEAFCKIERFLFTCNLYISIYFIMCISVIRYLAIVHPFFTHEHIHLKHAKIISVFIWIYVASISSPIFYYSSVKSNRCSLVSHKDKKLIVRVFMAVIGCLVPFVVTFASYFGILMTVFKNANITPLEKKKVCLIVGLVSILYAVSFLPYHILQIWHYSLKEVGILNYYLCNGNQMGKVLACLNMCFHPILYIVV